jgi:hypothetical protein
MPPKKKNFETARTRKFRETQLGPEDEGTISHIEEFGCSVVNVARSGHGLGWSYTIGIFDTTGKRKLSPSDYPQKPRILRLTRQRSYCVPALILPKADTTI